MRQSSIISGRNTKGRIFQLPFLYSSLPGLKVVAASIRDSGVTPLKISTMNLPSARMFVYALPSWLNYYCGTAR